MSILGIDPRDNKLRWPVGSPYQIRVQFADGAGGLLNLSGRDLRFAAFRFGGEVLFDAPFVIDGNTATVVFPGSVSLTPGLDGGAWQVAQLFEGGATPLFRGSVNTVDAAAGQGAGAGPPPSDLLTWAPATQTLLISSIGARGPSLSEELGTTPEALIAELVTAPVDAKLAAVDVTVAGKVDQVDDAITELGEFTSERSAEIDDKLVGVDTFVAAKNVAISAKLASVDMFVADKGVVIDASVQGANTARDAANTGAQNANDKAALAQSVVNAGGSILDAFAALSVQYLSAVEYGLSGYVDVIVDANLVVLFGIDRSGAVLVENVRAATVATAAMTTASAASLSAAANATAIAALQTSVTTAMTTATAASMAVSANSAALAPLGLLSGSLEYGLSGYVEFIADQDLRVIFAVDTTGAVFVEGVKVAAVATGAATAASAAMTAATTTATSVSSLGLATSALEYGLSGYPEFVADQDFRILWAVDTAGKVFVEGTQPALAKPLPALANNAGKVLTVNSGATAAVWAAPTGGGGGSTSRLPYIFIAAYNAPDYQKACADYVCTGDNDDLIIQSVIDNFPKLPLRIVTGCRITDALGGIIQLSLGVFRIANEIVFPSGSVIHFHGFGLSADRYDPLPDETDTNGGTPIYDGGTVIYSTATSGRILYWPRALWPRNDNPTVYNEVPVSGIYTSGFHAYVKNPTDGQTRQVAAIDCIGMATGKVENIYCISPHRGATGGKRIATGFSFKGGARSDMKEFLHCAASGFRSSALAVSTTHLKIDCFSANSIGGETNSCGASIVADNGVNVGYIHCFGTGVGINSYGAANLHVEHADFEAVQHAVVLDDKNWPIHFSKVSSENADTIWEGDLANYCFVDSVQRVGGMVRKEGFITIPAGQTSATLEFAGPIADRDPDQTKWLRMCGTPRKVIVTPKSRTGSGAWAEATREAITVSIPTAQATDAIINYDIRCA